MSFPGFSCEPILIRALDAFLSQIVDIGKPDHVRGHIGGRVIAPILATQIQAGDAHGGHPRCLIRG